MRAGERSTPAAGRTLSPDCTTSCGSEHPRVGGEGPGGLAHWVAHRGTPPRRLGRPVDGGGPAHRHRNTPASAGKTRSGSSSPPASAGKTWRCAGVPLLPAEHPRVGGEDCAAVVGPWRPSGTPSRRRGRPCEHLDGCGLRRDTPASAGKTLRPRHGSRCRTEHPRVGREDVVSRSTSGAAVGTPPHRRGGRPQFRLGGLVLRSTPASAGRTTGPASHCTPTTEHPRVGGEDPYRQSTETTVCGAPPRRRGGPPGPVVGTSQGRRGERRLDDVQPPHLRSTPASARETVSWRPSRRSAPEHPRVGGEDHRPAVSHRPRGGTAPRRRRGLHDQHTGFGCRRNTPASAGRTPTGPARPARRTGCSSPRRRGEPGPARSGARLRPGGTPPRRRGGHLGPDLPGDRGRNTPALAGRTPRRWASPSSSTEHPRAGEEDRQDDHIEEEMCGTPPRRRGGPSPPRRRGGR
jgi:hypothetical protein